jgi:hypothetical protein
MAFFFLFYQEGGGGLMTVARSVSLEFFLSFSLGFLPGYGG